jgi:hypothetical protein
LYRLTKFNCNDRTYVAVCHNPQTVERLLLSSQHFDIRQRPSLAEKRSFGSIEAEDQKEGLTRGQPV